MTVSEKEAATRAARAQQIALFRYALIRPAVDPGLTSRRRGAVVRALAERTHTGPDGMPVRVSRKSLDRWIRAWRAGGFDALVPAPRQVAPRTDATVLELAVGLKKENPARTATQVARILRAQLGWSPSDRTLQRHFAHHELNTRPDGQPPAAFGRFEARRINEIWVADVLHGPKIAGHKTYLFAILDDHSLLGAGDEADGARRVVGDIDELNRLFTAWVETEYHRRVHEETTQTPLQRYGCRAAGPAAERGVAA
jgi:putative transposase